jgi:hypothetical protein
MARLQTTAGQLMVNDVLPQDMRDYGRVLNKKSLNALLRDLALKHPEKYREVSQGLSQIGWQASYTTGGQSFGLQHLQASPVAAKRRSQLRLALASLYDDDSLSDEEREQKILRLVGKVSEKQEKEIFEEQDAKDNPLAEQVQAGSRGNKMNLASLLGSDLLYTDHRGRVIPFPVLKSYSQGLSPAEYWAGAYGARKGVIDVKMATRDAGFLSKQLNQIVHRGLITDTDEKVQKPGGPIRGFPVDTDDVDNEGASLAHAVGGYERNQTLTPKVLEDLLQRGFKRILVRSPAVGGPADGGVYARDAGVREFGRLPVRGENISLGAAQALSEPLTQAQLASKHSGGVATASASRAISGFDYINQMIQAPKIFKGGAAHAEVDGTVQSVEKAPAGGHYVTVGGEQHYVGEGYAVTVKPGEHIEAGDVISEGSPNPAVIVKHKGIGEGRRYFVKAFRDAYREAGLPSHRRNIELLSRGLINHVRMTDEAGDFNPDDIVSYAQLEHNWKPRPNTRQLKPSAAIGQHLERPVLHYSIGTRIRPRVARELEEFGVAQVDVHENPPPFEAEMIRGMTNLQHDPDWLTRMYGSGLQKSLLSATHRGAASDPLGTSFVPGLAQSAGFGQVGKVVTPKRAAANDRLEGLRDRVKSNKKTQKCSVQSLKDRIQSTREMKAQTAADAARYAAAFEHLARARERQVIERNRWLTEQAEAEAARPWYQNIGSQDIWSSVIPAGKVPGAVAATPNLYRALFAGEVGAGVGGAMLPDGTIQGSTLGLTPGQQPLIPVPESQRPKGRYLGTGEIGLGGNGSVQGTAYAPSVERISGRNLDELLLPDPGEEWKFPEGMSEEAQTEFLQEIGARDWRPAWHNMRNLIRMPLGLGAEETYEYTPREIVDRYNANIRAGQTPWSPSVARIMAMQFPEEMEEAVAQQRFYGEGVDPLPAAERPPEVQPSPYQYTPPPSPGGTSRQQSPGTAARTEPLYDQQPAPYDPSQGPQMDTLGGSTPQQTQPEQLPAPQRDAPVPSQPTAPPVQPRREMGAPTPQYTPGQGLMPLYQAAPQQVGQFLQSTGPLAPLGMAALADFNAFKTLTTPGTQSSSQLRATPPVAQNVGPRPATALPPAPSPAPAPAAPPAPPVPAKPPTPPKPPTPAAPKM